jgi:hypothetical protein
VKIYPIVVRSVSIDKIKKEARRRAAQALAAAARRRS